MRGAGSGRIRTAADGTDQVKIFTGLYDKCMEWARHRYAVRYLSALSFAESSFFPIPPDVMLAPMSMAQPRRAMFYAAVTTIASVLGGLLGYLIGTYASPHEMQVDLSRIKKLGYSPYFIKTQTDTFKLLVGAFVTKEGAEAQQAELQAKGIQTTVVIR